MQDPDTPPAVVEGEASGDVDVVRLIVVVLPMAVIVSSTAASIVPPWTTAIAPR
jgi:hypothetical protein